jgi:alpha-1,2-mannosyltransferase
VDTAAVDRGEYRLNAGQPISRTWLRLLLAYGLIWLAGALALGVRTPSPDWRTFYGVGRAVLNGTDWYAAPAGTVPNLTPPLVAPVFAALALLPIRLAFLIWTIAGLVAAFWAARRVAHVWRLETWHVIAVLLAFHGMPVGVLLGQLHLVTFVLVTAAWLADREDRPLAAGAWLGAAIYLKPFFGLVAVYWLWRRGWRAAGTATAVAGAGYGVGVIWLPTATAGWLDALRSVTWLESAVNLAVWGWVARLDMPVWIAVVLVALVLGLLLWQLPALTRDAAWFAVIVAACLVSPVAWLYYALPLVGPMGLLYLQGDRVTRRLIEVGYVGLCVPLFLETPPPVTSRFRTVILWSWYLWAFACWWLAGLRKPIALRRADVRHDAEGNTSV